MKEIELAKYEAPTISEYISWGWGQNIIARYLAWKVNRKLRRYNKRIKREEFIRKTLST